MKRTTSRRGLTKRLPVTKQNVSSSRMDVTYLDDSNDSGIGTESLHRLPNCRLDLFDQGSSDDRDSSSDSLDSGIFGLSSPESSCMDVGASVFEESGLASLLCQAVSISEDGGESRWESDHDEPPSKRCCLTEDDSTAEPLQSESSGEPIADQANSSTSHINLLGIAPQNEPPRLTPGKTGSSSSTPSSSSQNHSVRRKTNRKLPSLHVSYPFRSKDGDIELRILAQPEEQHRARYMTEGSRGAVKDRRGTGFPTVKLFGYNRPVTLQVFIGTDQGKIQPHLFYQACKVSGKNCTPCTERVIDGTAVIEICMLPEKDMTVSCDCIGILKERNVDVEQRLPYFSVTRAKKKNTLCRMVFRVNLPITENNLETLQAASSPILCTQPPGVPEISKKSTKECSVQGGAELFIIGKNFLKDTKVVFQEGPSEDDENSAAPTWQEVVDPEKEFLHQTHLVCRVPPYPNASVVEAKEVQLTVQSGGKTSEPHTFTYLPAPQGKVCFHG